MLKKVFLLFVLLSVFVAAAPITVAAQKATHTDDWEYGLTLYLWGASIGGKSASGSEIDVDFDDILDSLEFAFMGAAEARKGRWLLAADVIFMDVDENKAITPNLTANVELRTWIITPMVGYNLVDTGKGRLDILGGARYLDMEADLRLRLFDLPEVHVEDSSANWDGIIGLKGTVDLSEKWHLFGHLDIGAGDSDSTWQAVAGIGYKFKWGHVNAAYRFLKWDFDDNRAVDDLDISGPGLAIKFLF